MTPENEAVLPSHVHAALANAGILALCSHGSRNRKFSDDFDVFMKPGNGLTREQILRLMEDCPEFTAIDPSGVSRVHSASDHMLLITFDYKAS